MSTVPNGRPPVAIIGIGCRFPGGVNDPESFWRFLAGGGDAIGEIPADRIDLARYYDPKPRTPGRMSTRFGGFLPNIDTLDVDTLGLSPREAELLDPQQRLLLEVGWEAVEDAGLDLAKLDGARGGVFVGQWLSDFEGRLNTDPEAFEFFTTSGSGRYAASGRLSHLLGLRGPSLTIDTACSSSLAAIHLAARSIQNGDSTVALAGGVNVILLPHISIAYSQSGMMAADGRCKFGDAGGDGYVRSEGAAVVVLKALDQAVADGDRIYAVVRGGAINNDGRSGISMGTPSQIGQEELLRSAYADAGVAPGAVGYVEAHGTGTRAGDPVELGALGAVLGEGRPHGRKLQVGSVKTNFGHTEGAAGVAGLIKAALAVQHGQIPQSLNCRTLTPSVAWDSAPFAVAREASAFAPGERLAGVSAFGIAGTNAHIVLGQAPDIAAPHAGLPADAPALLPLSARSPEALRALALRYADRLSGPEAASLHDVCFAAATRRSAHDHRAAFVATESAGMVDMLRRYAAGESAATVEGVARAGDKRKLAFVVPGQGAQYAGMARALLRDAPAFRTALERCEAAAAPYIDWSIIEQITAEPGTPAFKMDRIDVIQPVLVALAIAYAELMRAAGIVPDAAVGHSMGEVGAAYVAGVLDIDRAMQIICRRSALMRSMSGKGAMALVELSLTDARARIAGLEHALAVGASNGPRSSVLSGDPDAMKRVLAGLEQDGVFCRLIKVDVASHSPHMAGPAADLANELAGMVPGDGRIPVYSTVLGKAAPGATFDATYWARNLREPVLFADAVRALAADGVTSFVELGPHPVLLPSVQQTATGAATIACGRREEPEQLMWLTALAGLWVAGHRPDWAAVLVPASGPVRLPLYPWQRQRFWPEGADIAASSGQGRRAAGGRPDDETKNWLHRLGWVAEDSTETAAHAEGGWLVAADDAAIGPALRDALGAAGADARLVPLAELEAALKDAPALAGIVVLAAGTADDAYLPVRALHAHAGGRWTTSPKLWLVTQSAQAVDTAERVSVDQSALWGAGRVIAEEHPGLWGGLVDLGGAGDIAAAVRHILAPGGENQAAFRGGHRHVLRIRRLEADEIGRGAPFAWRADASYLITGGLGDVSLHVAKAMAASGARRLVLLGRTGLPPRGGWATVAPDSRDGRRIEAVKALEALGVAVHLAVVDVADEADLSAFLARYAAEGRPPIRGVVHAAGSFRNELAHGMDRAAFEAVAGPKLRGAQLLDTLLPDLDLFVLFSSTGGFLSQAGQANYGAANAGLDALALDRQARGLPALSLAWGVWRGSGLVADAAGAANVAEMARQGLDSFAPERAAALFPWLCGRPEPTLTVANIDWAKYAAARAGRSQALFAGLVAGTATGGAGVDLATGLETMAPGERRAAVEALVRDSVGKVLRLPAGRIDAKRPLGNMGLTSLMAMEFRNRLEVALARPLPATLAWNYPTIEALVEHLGGAPPATPVPEPQAAPAALAEVLSDVAALSDEEVLLSLRSRPARGSRR
ncbi:MAG TPA: type I polyketide synthase [Xanthobacteraceae bacterium]|nr:type I polyketide synthase [Xanthobacteraceae bacterium]